MQVLQRAFVERQMEQKELEAAYKRVAQAFPGLLPSGAVQIDDRHLDGGVASGLRQALYILRKHGIVTMERDVVSTRYHITARGPPAVVEAFRRSATSANVNPPTDVRSPVRTAWEADPRPPWVRRDHQIMNKISDALSDRPDAMFASIETCVDTETDRVEVSLYCRNNTLVRFWWDTFKENRDGLLAKIVLIARQEGSGDKKVLDLR